MRAMLVVVLLELDELPLEISRGPEQQAVQTFAPYRPDQPFDDRVGTRHVRHGLDLSDIESPSPEGEGFSASRRLKPTKARRSR